MCPVNKNEWHHCSLGCWSRLEEKEGGRKGEDGSSEFAWISLFVKKSLYSMMTKQPCQQISARNYFIMCLSDIPTGDVSSPCFYYFWLRSEKKYRVVLLHRAHPVRKI